MVPPTGTRKRHSPTDRQVSPITKALIGYAGRKASCKDRALVLIRNRHLSSERRAEAKLSEPFGAKRMKLDPSTYKSPSDKLISPIARALDGNHLTMKEKAQLMLRRYQVPHKRSASARSVHTPLPPTRSKFSFYVEECGQNSKRSRSANSSGVPSPSVRNAATLKNDENVSTHNFTPATLGKRKAKSKVNGASALTPRPVNVDSLFE